jgi:hypothetical protein
MPLMADAGSERTVIASLQPQPTNKEQANEPLCDPPPGLLGHPGELQATAAKSAQVGEEMADDVRWIRTYVVEEESGKLGTLCIYQGTSAEKVREQAERTGMPADEITLVADTVIVRPDPVAATA